MLGFYGEYWYLQIPMTEFIIDYELEERYRCLLYRIHFYCFC